MLTGQNDGPRDFEGVCFADPDAGEEDGCAAARTGEGIPRVRL